MLRKANLTLRKRNNSLIQLVDLRLKANIAIPLQNLLQNATSWVNFLYLFSSIPSWHFLHIEHRIELDGGSVVAALTQVPFPKTSISVERPPRYILELVSRWLKVKNGRALSRATTAKTKYCLHLFNLQLEPNSQALYMSSLFLNMLAPSYTYSAWPYCCDTIKLTCSTDSYFSSIWCATLVGCRQNAFGIDGITMPSFLALWLSSNLECLSEAYWYYRLRFNRSSIFLIYKTKTVF